MKVTYLIVPPVTDDPNPNQARIYSREHADHLAFGLRDYRDNPDHWKEAGLINHQGKLVCLDAPPTIYQDMKDQEPLMASTSHTYTVE